MQSKEASPGTLQIQWPLSLKSCLLVGVVYEVPMIKKEKKK